MTGPSTQWQVPTRVVFGRGSLATVGVETAALGTRAAVVIDRSVAVLPCVRTARDMLHESDVHVPVVVHVDEPPTAARLREDAVRIGAAGCDVVVAVGGGSTLDSAKLLAMAVTNPGLLADRALDVRRVIDLDDRREARPRPGLPTLLAPSTSATGSEVNTVAALRHQGRKTLLVSGLLAASTALVDPVLTDTVPSHQTAEGGVETFARLACPYLVDGDAVATTDLLAEQLAARCLAVTAEACTGAAQVTAREDLAWLVTVSGTQLAGLGRPAWAHVLWYLQDAVADFAGTAKGPAMAALLPTYLAVIGEGTTFGGRLGSPDRLARLARALAPTAIDGVSVDRMIAAQLRSWGQPTSLCELGLSREQAEQVAGTTHAQWGNSGRLDGVSRAELSDFYARAWSVVPSTPEHPAQRDDHQLSILGRR